MEVKDGFIQICFDGGTASNIPPFGNAYGSFKIGEGKIVRLDFETNASANCAEMWTGLAALKEAQKSIHGDYKIHLTGDSQIALLWFDAIFYKRNRKMSKKVTLAFSDTVRQITEFFDQNLRLTELVTEWKPRRFSVKLFGH